MQPSMMKKGLLFLYMLIAIGSFRSYAQKYQVAILDPIFENPDSSYAHTVRFIVKSELTSNITRTPGFESYTRSGLDQLQQEWAFQASGFVNDSQRAKLGEMTGVDYICSSRITSYGGELVIEASLINVETGEIIGADNQYVSSSKLADIGSACSVMAKGMLDAVLKTGSHGSVFREEKPPVDNTALQMVKLYSLGLYVEKKDRPAMSWEDAQNACSMSGYRLPSIQELSAIYRMTLGNKTACGSPFGNTSYWTYEKRNNFSAFSFDFFLGETTYESMTSQSKFRCVREISAD